MSHTASIAALQAALAEGRTTASALTEEALARIADPAGEGARAFISVFVETARAEAESADRLRRAGDVAGRPLLGIPVSVKDLFDVQGQVTTVGSTVLRSTPPAARDAEILWRLREAGAVIIGRTNMTEFAFSGLGINPHYGTPRNPWDRATERIPGGSSSGAAVSVASGMCAAAIGSDTGGSVRIPSALCGLTGFKPTQAAVPLQGCYPLSPTLDSIGPLAWNVADCALLYGVMADEDAAAPEPTLPARLRLLAPENYVTDGLDPAVAADFEAALARLAAAGHQVEHRPVAAFARIAEMGAIGTFPALEAWAAQKDRLASHGDEFDPRVRSRIEAAATLPADTHARLTALRARYVAEFRLEIEEFDALVCPTVALVAPAIAALDDETEYGRVNLLMLRNCTTTNLADGCALSLPMQAPGAAPTGLMLAAAAGSDRRILAIGAALEPVVRQDE